MEQTSKGMLICRAASPSAMQRVYLIGRTHGHRGFIDDDLAARHVVGNFGGDGHDRLQVSTAIG